MMGIAGIAAGFMNNLLGGKGGSILETGAKLIGEFHTSDAEKLELKNEERRDEMEHKETMRSMDIKEQGLYLADVGSARDNQSQIQEAEHGSWMSKNIQPFLALLTNLATYFLLGLLIWLIFSGKFNNIPAYAISIISIILGNLSSDKTQCNSFYFGSSQKGNSSDQNSGLSKFFPKINQKSK